MQVERAPGRHRPNRLGQHPEGDDDLQVGPQSTQLADEPLVFEVFGLQDRKPLRKGILLDGRSLKHTAMASYRFIGHGDDSHNAVAALDKGTQTGYSKLGRTHKYYSQVVFFHTFSFYPTTQMYAIIFNRRFRNRRNKNGGG